MAVEEVLIALWLETKQNKFRQLQRTLYRTAKQSKAVKFLQSVRQSVAQRRAPGGMETGKAANRGAPGVDSETIEGIVSRGEEEGMLSRLQEQLRAKNYRFQPVRESRHPETEAEVLGHWELRRFKIA